MCPRGTAEPGRGRRPCGREGTEGPGACRSPCGPVGRRRRASAGAQPVSHDLPTGPGCFTRRRGPLISRRPFGRDRDRLAGRRRRSERLESVCRRQRPPQCRRARSSRRHEPLPLRPPPPRRGPPEPDVGGDEVEEVVRASHRGAPRSRALERNRGSTREKSRTPRARPRCWRSARPPVPPERRSSPRIGASTLI
jgi:hypothetical protein